MIISCRSMPLITISVSSFVDYFCSSLSFRENRSSALFSSSHTTSLIRLFLSSSVDLLCSSQNFRKAWSSVMLWRCVAFLSSMTCLISFSCSCCLCTEAKLASSCTFFISSHSMSLINLSVSSSVDFSCSSQSFRESWSLLFSCRHVTFSILLEAKLASSCTLVMSSCFRSLFKLSLQRCSLLPFLTDFQRSLKLGDVLLESGVSFVHVSLPVLSLRTGNDLRFATFFTDASLSSILFSSIILHSSISLDTFSKSSCNTCT